MAYRLDIDVVDAEDGAVHVTHTFWGRSEREVRSHFRTLEQSCPDLAAAVKDDRVAEDLEEIDEDELPEVDDDDDDGEGDDD